MAEKKTAAKEQEPSLFLSRRKHVNCVKCNGDIYEGDKILAIDEKKRGFCERCANLRELVLLPPGDVAMTRRSKKFSSRTVVFQQWNNRRRRYERKGQYVEPKAIEEARLSCEADREKREATQKKAAAKRIVDDAIYRKMFAIEIRSLFPNMPSNREVEVANHACEKYSGRVGRTASAKEFDEDMITRAVIAHIRHQETDYDDRFGKGKRKREIRDDIRGDVKSVLRKWK